MQKRGQEGCKGREVMEDQSGTVPSEHDRPLHSGTHSGGIRPALDQANHHSTKEEGGACGPTPNRGAVGSPVQSMVSLDREPVFSKGVAPGRLTILQ